MSSYVISKYEYMKAAGIVAGLSDKAVWGWQTPVYVPRWDDESEQMTDENASKKLFATLFAMNAKSVAQQYAEPGDKPYDESEFESDADPNDYSQYFDEVKYSIKIDIHSIQHTLYCLSQFFQSILYQIDNKEYYDFAEKQLNDIIIQLTFWISRQVLGKDNTECWGKLNLL